ncbi:retron St85 family RNA-directed DNA polymerase [Shewanella acanthi]|uniref:retron St85 family RNA-directed DNA polymerase n=1 Tax=Shewanella acanthi TaxID=2864212 RepID=UPI001C65E0FF|nr:retron St85 family RNA-directed DNA polymerase [Shewanella acanthi]QYJ79858.1 retron St85 family RNA-directed DNA polymerase [Shewanella acanthi]
MDLVKNLANNLGKRESEVRRFLADAPNKYRVYKIPKRSYGHRVIAQPSKELKDYQRAFLQLYTFPVHRAAMAYCKGKSIKENAQAHASKKYLLKTDLENFFNSITPRIFWEVVRKNTDLMKVFTSQEVKLVEKLLFWCPSKTKSGKLILSVGAPTSPTISNFCMSEFDKQLSQLCKVKDIVYTRYADDLTFSTNEENLLFKIIPEIQSLLTKNFSFNIKLNHSKTVFSSKAHNRHVTGVTLSNNGKISLGRDRKRYIKHLIHQFKHNQLDTSEIHHLRGMLSFAKHIEPIFIKRLSIKYTDELIRNIYEAQL